jgi:putative hemolysin
VHIIPAHSCFVFTSVFLSFSWGVGVGLLLIIILLFCSAMVSGSEMAFFSLTPVQLHELQENKSPANIRVLNLLEHPKRLLATILIGNNFMNIAIVIISTYVTQHLFDFRGHEVLGFIMQFIIVASLILLIAEVMPKILASQRPMQFVYIMVKPMHLLIQIFYPISSIMVSSTRFLERRIEKKGHNISLDELTDVIEMTSSGSAHEQEKNILRGIVKFGDMDVKDVMRSRVDVTAVEKEMPYNALLTQIMESGFSRLPVYDESLDKILGILYIKDLLPYLDHKGDFNWHQLIRPAFFIPENKKISDLLMEFKEKKIHLAIVVDEYGGTSGIVTLEDIIEEIVGEINDEYDDEPMETFYTRIDKNVYIFEAKTSINDFIKITGCDEDVFADIPGEYDSLAGMVLEITGKIPVKNETIVFKHMQFSIESADDRRIKQIRVTINEGKGK